MIQIRNQAEIEKIRKACRISAEALKLGGEMVRPGISTAEIDKAIENYITRKGARPNFKGYGGFPGSACISLNDTVIHGIPSGHIIVQPGDIVSIDVGAELDGYHGDNAATFCCGEVSETAQKLLQATEASLYKGIEAAQPGNRVGDIGYAVQSYVEERGYSVVRDFVGHGVGTHLHEDPEVPNFGRPGYGPRLVPGMVIAIEPMINEKGAGVHVLGDEWTIKTNDGGLSAHFEHTIAITKDGPIILTKL